VRISIVFIDLNNLLGESPKPGKLDATSDKSDWLICLANMLET